MAGQLHQTGSVILDSVFSCLAGELVSVVVLSYALSGFTNRTLPWSVLSVVVLFCSVV